MSPVSPLSVPQDAIARAMVQARGRYAFAEDGGAVSTIALTTGTLIPSGSIVIGGYIDVLTALTSGGAATIAVQVEAAGDIVGTVAVASWTLGRKNIKPALAAGDLTANAAVVKTTADRNISAVVATAALTAGVFEVVLLIIPPLA